ncbi:ExsB protein [Microvirga lotononidis]|uniref:7-cyano-7-deazaguanine synthase n=1 Tax=Microvirga lotononidis TaxID=864069 RepID=I4YMZ4_9HYPH|nr:ExsB protein [Microvirga lotononidis]
MKALVICSGGLVSVTLAHKVVAERTLTRLVSFDYGQRHKMEREPAPSASACRMDIVDISAVGRLLAGSALTSGEPVPERHYAGDTKWVTVVHNRNAIMLAIAFGIPAARGV